MTQYKKNSKLANTFKSQLELVKKNNYRFLKVVSESACILFASTMLTGCFEEESTKSVIKSNNQESVTKSYPIDSIVAIDVGRSKKNNPVILKQKTTGSDKAILDGVNGSQIFLGNTDIEKRLQQSLPEIHYTIKDLPKFAKTVNSVRWKSNKNLDKATIIKIQALLNWNSHGVGAVSGQFTSNTRKAIQTFQKANGIKGNGKMTAMTWSLLNANKKVTKKPVLVNYVLTKEDVSLPRQRKNTQYHTIKEAVAEKFHMSRSLLTQLNPRTPLRAGNTITVYNPNQPNLKPISYVEVYKVKNLLVAYDDNNQVVASYPTTIGFKTPNGTHKVVNRVHKPYYNSDFSNKAATKPPGPNNPVGLVWLGLSKPSFGLHGSPEPEMISRQRSGGCVRLTNWDALSLYGTIQDKAVVTFKNQ